MSFKKFLLESTHPDAANIEKDFLRNIKKDCGNFLKDAVNYPPVFRGMRNPNYELLKKVVRKDRRPRDTDRLLSEIFDEILLYITGIRGRTQASFASTDVRSVATYGDVHYMFPVGDYKIIYSPEIYDLTIQSSPFSVPSLADKNLSQAFMLDFIAACDGVVEQKYIDGLISHSEMERRFGDVMREIYSSILWEAYRPILYHAFEQLFKKTYQVVDSFELVDDSHTAKPELMIVCDEYYAIPTGYRFDEFGELDYDALLNKIVES